MALSFTIVDNEDETVTYTVTGAGASEAYGVFSCAVDGDLGSSTWTLADSGVADGSGNSSDTIDVDAGYYWWQYIAPLTPTVSEAVYQNVTDGTASIFEQCLDAVQSRVQGLTLAGVNSNSVVVRKLPWDRDLAKPAVIVSPVPERISPTGGTTAKDDYSYGVMVSAYRESNQKLADSLGVSLLWRQKIKRAFLNQRLPGVDEVHRCLVEPGEPLIPAAFAAHYDAQFLVVRCEARETRGVA